MVEIGISSGFYYDRGLLGVVGEFKDAGFRVLEVFGAPRSDFEYVHFNWHDKKVVSELVKRLGDLALCVNSFHAPFSNLIDISCPDEALRKRSVDEICCAMDAARELNAEFLVVHPSSFGVPISEIEKRFSHARKSLGELYLRVPDAGIKLAVENQLPHILGGNPETLFALIEGFSEDTVCICFDSSHANLYPQKNVAATYEILASRIKTMHISDNRGAGDDHMSPGSGTINWPDFIAAINKSGYQGIFMLEVIEKMQGVAPQEVLRLARGKAESFFAADAQTKIRGVESIAAKKPRV